MPVIREDPGDGPAADCKGTGPTMEALLVRIARPVMLSILLRQDGGAARNDGPFEAAPQTHQGKVERPHRTLTAQPA